MLSIFVCCDQVDTLEIALREQLEQVNIKISGSKIMLSFVAQAANNAWISTQHK